MLMGTASSLHRGPVSGAVARTRLPLCPASVGAVPTWSNFGAKETVPESIRDRNLYVHNPQVR